MTQNDLPSIPQKITVHLGAPNSGAENITINFTDYIKNIASNEIYPIWQDSSIRANILALISFVHNRIYTEYYLSQGYDFDITNDMSVDPNYIPDGVVYQNISQIVDEIFDQYITRNNGVEPLFAQCCDGVKSLCPGLSKWGSVELAQQRKTPLEILKHYYGEDISIVTNAKVEGIKAPFPTKTIKLGRWGEDVKGTQIKLNRISYNYPSIPKIQPVDGVFSYATEDAVREFQKLFGISQDGIVGKATWYQIKRIYDIVKNLNKLGMMKDQFDNIPKQFQQIFTLGVSSNEVKYLQYMLAYLAQFNDRISEPEISGTYDEQTKISVIDFQNAYGLTPDGIIGPLTYTALYNAYRGAVLNIDEKFTNENIVPYQGPQIRLGSNSDAVRLIQEYLNYIATVYTEIPSFPVTGYYGFQTQKAVATFQQLFNTTPSDGVVNENTWNEISNLYSDLYKGNILNDGQFTGENL